MEITLSSTPPFSTKADLLVVACEEDALAQHPHVAALDEALAGTVRQAMADERFKGKQYQTVTIHTQSRLPAKRIALVGVGDRSGLRPSTLTSFAGRAARLANDTGAASMAIALPPSLVSTSAELPALVQALALGVRLGAYRFEKYLASDKRSAATVTTVDLLVAESAISSSATIAVQRAERIAAAVARARDLVNEPAAVMTPRRLAEVAKEIADDNHLELKVLGPKECAAEGMGLFLAVAQGSAEEPRFIHLAWKPPGVNKRVVLVGKGVTFDSGGLSLKTNDNMLDMKTDMAGAAAVLSVMEAVAREGLAVEVHALAACTENMPGGRSYKLGDILRSKAGKTVEINNTDAEGRLTLADAIIYGLALEPEALLDFATLTGACVVALGPHIAGVMSNNEALQKDWLDCATAAGEEMWPLPLPERLVEQLKSDLADMKNTGARWGGALTAGLFLKEFVGDLPWVHVDIAGPSASEKEHGHLARGGTGFAVATIFEYLYRVSTN